MASVDLHLHTTASDGRLSPTQLVDVLAKQGVRLAAITDHDTTNGLAEAFRAAKRYPGMEIIPGIELSTDIPGNEIHMLGYLMDYHSPAFQDRLSHFRAGREGRAEQMVQRLNEMGMAISYSRVKELAGDGSVGRPHVALALLEKGYIKDVPEAFDKYIGRTGPAYVEREKMTPAEAIGLLRQYGGVPVLAHPLYVDNVESFLEELKAAGLSGMEVFYADYDDGQVAQLQRMAERYGLLPCGGSDYHALGTSKDKLPGARGPSVETVKEIRRLAAAAKAAKRGSSRPASG